MIRQIRAFVWLMTASSPTPFSYGFSLSCGARTTGVETRLEKAAQRPRAVVYFS